MPKEPVLSLTAFSEVSARVACPGCGRVLPRVHRREAWVEVPVAQRWIAGYRLVVRGRRPLVAEVRLFPAEDDTGRLAGRWTGQPGAVPPEGVPGRAIRGLRLKTPLGLFPRFLSNWERHHGQPAARKALGRHGLSLGSELGRRRPGRAGRPDAYYLPWATAYLERLASGSRRPIKDLAEHPPAAIAGYVSSVLADGAVSEATVRDLVHQARTRGLLSSSPAGQPGGELTPKAQRMLRSAGARRHPGKAAHRA